jgi:hypothetical protein
MTITEDNVVIRLRGWYRYLAARKEVAVPLAELTAASVHPDPMSLVRGIKVVGTTIPLGVQVGTFNPRRGKFWGTDFFAVARNQPALVLELSGQGRFDRIVVEVEEPERSAAEIREKVQADATE